MRIVASCSLGGGGHLDPLIPLLSAGQRLGHEVLVVGPPSIADQVSRGGHEFFPGADPLPDDLGPLRERIPFAPPAEAAVLANGEIFARLGASAMMAGVHEAVDTFKPDLILREPREFASAVVALRTGVPTATVAIALSEVEEVALTAASAVLEETQGGLTDWIRNTTYLSRFPASLDPPSFQTSLRYRQEHRPNPYRLPRVWQPDSARPVIYVTLGTALGHMATAPDVYRTIIDALANLEVRAILTVGTRLDPTQLDPLPDNVHIESWIDQADVLDQVEMAVCHGGSGTVLGCLAAGVPMVVVPLFADQFRNAQRISDCGAGICARPRSADEDRRPIAETDVGPIASAIAQVLQDRTSYRSKAQQLAAEIKSSESPELVLEHLLSR